MVVINDFALRNNRSVSGDHIFHGRVGLHCAARAKISLYLYLFVVVRAFHVHPCAYCVAVN